MKGYKTLTRVITGILLFVIVLSSPVEAVAAIKEATVFRDAEWNYVAETTLKGGDGWLQSMCATEDYIVCLENASSETDDPDTLVAFYRNPYDENGNPVEQYSVAKYVTETDYEHGNGMTYNPVTDEIAIVGATPLHEENRGVVYLVDPHTLQLKRKVKVSNMRISAIGYSADLNQYVLLPGKGSRYFFATADSELNLTDTIFEATDEDGSTFQDLCVSGDYIIILPVKTSDPILQVYSLSEQRLLGTYDLYIPVDESYVEPESISELGPGQIIVANALMDPSRIAFYITNVEPAFKVTTDVENGTVTSSQKKLDQGSSFTVSYKPDTDYELNSLLVDGEEKDIKVYPSGYTFDNIQEDHTLKAVFTEIPKFMITTSVENGTIHPSSEVRRDKDLTISYWPDQHYEIDTLTIDGELVSTKGHEESYTFADVQEEHSIAVSFKKIPHFTVSTEVVNGTITDTDNEVYRDTYYTVAYRPKREDYEIAHIYIDGKEVDDLNIGTNGNKYTFENIQKGHSIKVVYQWKYLPAIILGYAWAVMWLMILVSIQRTRNKKKIARKRERQEE